MSWRTSLKGALGPRWTTTLRCLARGKPIPVWGNLRRAAPFSTEFGFDRGLPVDRYYLHRFLDEHRDLVRGDVLEIQSSDYTHRYGAALGRTDSVDILAHHRPTFVCDLAESDAEIASDAYDCFLLPSSLSFFRDLEGALRHALRVVRPGGSVLATAACMVPLISDGPDYWRMSAAGWEETARRVWPGCDVEVRAWGNCLAANAALLGLAAEELSPEELDAHDPRYPVTVSLRCRKPFAR